MTDPVLLNSQQMAHFTARGFLRFDAVVPNSINQAFLSEIGAIEEMDEDAGMHAEDADMHAEQGIAEHYAHIMASSAIPVVHAGTLLADAYPPGCALSNLMALPEVRGTIESLVGKGCIFDHHFLHVSFPERFYQAVGRRNVSQHTHQDSTIDPRRAFDVQIMYFPHEVTREMGGTRFVPGTHLRVVSEAAISRYQNMLGQQHVVCPAGTLLFMHHGMWHGGGVNLSERMRYMFKIRLCPTVRQTRLWDTSDLPSNHLEQRPIFWFKGQPDPEHIHSTLTKPEPWHEQDTGRLEYLNRIRFWRYLLGDERFDADYWITRVENEPS